jgi:hypothetical protein
MAGVSRDDLIPAAPFREYLNQRIAFWEKALGEETGVNRGPDGAGPQRRVCDELGWVNDSGIRRLYRMRNGLRGVGRNKASRDVPTEHFSRAVVEDALHFAGIDFTDMYLSYARRLEGRPGPARVVLTFIDSFELMAEELCAPVEVREAWCSPCGEVTLRDGNGDCHWCAGAREFQRRLAQRASYLRARERRAAERLAA